MQETDIVSKNTMEDLVEEKLDYLIHFAGICDCKYCRADIRTLSLNSLPPKYVMRVSGDVFVRFQSLDAQAQADIATAIMNAIEIVRENPRHDRKDLLEQSSIF